MKLNIANPYTGKQKTLEIDSEENLRYLYDKTLSSEIEGTKLDSSLKNIKLKITGGQDKQGFAMKQGILTSRRVKILLQKGSTGCRGLQMKKGERKRKSIRGCIVSPEIRTLNLVILNDNGIQHNSEDYEKNKLTPRRASKLRKIFSINKGDDIRKFIINQRQNEIPAIKKKIKIQRFISPENLQRKRRIRKQKRDRFQEKKEKIIEYSKIYNDLPL
mmetsp:Transcript_4884/g.7852  ORF Transcript_4884/g.7852 Transcript_4884/m.7852 type:complete len:217 (+) Transcript_4884:47-697(+)